MITEEEKRIIKKVQNDYQHPKCVRWLPMAWSVNLLKELRRKKFIGIYFIYSDAIT